MGVLSHEISHVALRHTTAQRGKEMLAELGVAALGVALGGGGRAQAAQLGAQAGLKRHMLKFNRDYETQADVLGAQIMARAGYSPSEMVSFLRRLEGEGRRAPALAFEPPRLAEPSRSRNRGGRDACDRAAVELRDFGVVEDSGADARPDPQSTFDWRPWGNCG